MKLNLFDNDSLNLFKKAMDVYNKQHEAIAINVANVNNPSFSRKKTDFSDMLQSESEKVRLRSNSSKHITQPNFDTSSLSSDKTHEKVDITREMSELAENQIRHEFVAKRINGFYQTLSNSIKGKSS